ncbi:MAG: AarF/UbiB family protein [Spirochaetota bacterium]|nr:AarF/UbiB family protein [Spirochaetota bacterium]
MKIQKRFLRVAWLFFKIFIDFHKEYRLIRKRGFNYALPKMEKSHKKRATELYNLALSLEGVLIKLCQFISSRRDFFPSPYIEILTPLQDEVPSIDFKEIEKIIEQEYRDYKTIFKTIERIPIASASLGQVHRAILNDDTIVVLKILKPAIEKIFDTDLAILQIVFSLFSNFSFIRDRMDIEGIMEQFTLVTGDELNFRREAHNAIRFKKAFDKYNFIKIPTIYDEFCTDRIIVMEYIEGDKITEIERWSKRNNDPKILTRRLIEIYLEQFLFIRLIHYDPHPGNILVLDNNCIALIDFGMTGELTEKMSSSIYTGLLATLNKDYEVILNILDDLNFFKKGTNIYTFLPIVQFFLDTILPSVKLERESILAIDISPILDDLVEIMYSNSITFPAEFSYIGKTVGTLAGIIALLYPDMNIYNELRPYFRRILERNFLEMANRIYEQAKGNIKDVIIFPKRINRIIGRIEKRNLVLRVEQDGINESLLNIQSSINRGISLILSLLSFFFAYILYILKHNNGTILFSSLGIIFLLYFLLYRKEIQKRIIKKRIS